MKGIDVSSHNGKIDFAKVKSAGIDFVIIRAGYGKTAGQKDAAFESNYAAAKAAGMHVGAYWYSYASTVEESAQEARACLQVIEGKQFDFPIYFDIEEKKQFDKGIHFCSDCVKTFCDMLEMAGYFTGFYTGRYAAEHYFREDVRKRYAFWLAEWSEKVYYSGQYGMWQHSSKGKINGISGNVDLDISYTDYPTIIRNKALNGFTANAPVERFHTVAEGETLSAIAGMYGTTVDEIAAKNNMIQTGDVLKV